MSPQQHHVTYGGISEGLTNTIYLPRARSRAQRRQFSRTAVGAFCLIGLAALSHRVSHGRGLQWLAASPGAAPGGGGAAPGGGAAVGAEGELKKVEGEVEANWVGMMEALAVIFAAEIGDKSFFVALILAMRYDKWAIFVGCMGALTIMAVVSAVLGALIAEIDHSVLQWAAAVTYLVCGLIMVKDGYEMEEDGGNRKEAQEELEKEGLVEHEGGGELSEDEIERTKSCEGISWWTVCGKSFMLMLVAEFGDRTQMAIIVLCSRHDPTFVCVGSLVGFAIVTFGAIVCGQFLSGRVSERLVTLCGGGIFLLFALISFLEATKVLQTDL